MERSYLSLLTLTLVTLTILVGLAHGEMKPTKFAKEVVCEGCHAVISEANKILGKGRRTDKAIKNALGAICNTQRLNQYEFSPPTMNKVCTYWTDNYEVEIKSALTNGLPQDEQEIELCFTTTDICVGVDRSKFRINKYEGPSKRKILAAKNAAKGESDEADKSVDEEEVAERVKKEDAKAEHAESKKTNKEDKKEPSISKSKVKSKPKKEKKEEL